jgi:hypothetical protein
MWFASFVPNVRDGMLVYRLLFTRLCLGVGIRADRRGSVSGSDCILVTGDVGWGREYIGYSLGNVRVGRVGPY